MCAEIVSSVNKSRSEAHNPADLMMLETLKGAAILALSQSSENRWLWDGAYPTISGSTWKHQAATIPRTDKDKNNKQHGLAWFPYGSRQGGRVSDFDFTVYDTSNTDSDSFLAYYDDNIGRLLKEAAIRGQFDICFLKPGVTAVDLKHEPYLELLLKDPVPYTELYKHPPGLFSGCGDGPNSGRPFYISMEFTPERIHETLRNRLERRDNPSYQDIIPFIRKTSVRYCLQISPERGKFPFMLPPIDLYPRDEKEHKDRVQIKREHRLPFFVNKLVRTMGETNVWDANIEIRKPKKPGDIRKPTDILDIYDCVKGKYLGNGRPIVDLDTDSPYNDISTIRVMTLMEMAAWRVWSPEMRNDLLVPFEDSPENRRVFLEDVKPQVSSLLYPEIERNVSDIFKTCNNAIRVIFSPLQGKEKFGVLNLAREEVDVLNYINGVKLHEGLVPTRRENFVHMVARQFKSSAKIPDDYKYPMPSAEVAPSLEIEKLKELHPRAFDKTRYPGLEECIESNLFINRWMRAAEARHAGNRNDLLLGG